jgi:hypothetical protein
MMSDKIIPSAPAVDGVIMGAGASQLVISKRRLSALDRFIAVFYPPNASSHASDVIGAHVRSHACRC